VRPGDGRLPSRLFFVADAGHAPDGLPALFTRAAAAGLDFLELRRKEGAGTAARVSEARACLAAAPRAVVLVNDRVDVALAAGAQGAHLGQDDLPAADARALLGPGRWLGLSTHDDEQFARGRETVVDYLALGPIFESSTKSGHAAVVGLEALRRCCASTQLPVVAIGGLDPERARLALQAGASAVAVASGISLGDFEANVAAFQQACELDRARPWMLSGLPGSGKSTTGRELARLSGRRFIDLDERVEAAAGLSVRALFSEGGEAAFRERERLALESLLGEPGPPPVVALGGGTLNQPACREVLDRAAARIAWLDSPPAICARRLGAAARERPLLGRATGVDLERALEQLLGERSATYARGSLRVDATASPELVAAVIWEAWAPRRIR